MLNREIMSHGSTIELVNFALFEKLLGGIGVHELHLESTNSDFICACV
jgi:hypothetical protein